MCGSMLGFGPRGVRLHQALFIAAMQKLLVTHTHTQQHNTRDQTNHDNSFSDTSSSSTTCLHITPIGMVMLQAARFPLSENLKKKVPCCHRSPRATMFRKKW